MELRLGFLSTLCCPISIERLPQGIYIIEVTTTEGRGYKNFIKQ